MLIKLMRYLGDQANGVLTLRVKANIKIDVDALEAYINTKSLEVSDAVMDIVSQTKKTVWLEEDRVRWKGEPPKVEVLYDETNAFLLVVLFQVNMRNTEAAEDDLMDIFLDLLRVSARVGLRCFACLGRGHDLVSGGAGEQGDPRREEEGLQGRFNCCAASG